jgi:archaellum component FlaG (FlaF/FlaG flagellin family)
VRLAVLASALLALLTAAPAGAVTLPPSDSPLPGSGFQGADGNQDDAAPYIDWAGTEDAGRVAHSPDPNAQDSAFHGGSKEDEPENWDLVTHEGGVTPGKDNIRDAWSSVDQAGPNTFLYMAFARQAETGTSYVAFELNRDARLWDNGRARIPCRLDGDVLIAFQAHGSIVSVVVQRWETRTTDPATNCARTGVLVDSSSFTANVEVQGAVNEATIANTLPGSFGGTIAAHLFGEAAINLGKVLDQAFGDSCLAFASIWMHSRSSTSESSDLHDYVAPRPLEARTCAAAGTKFLDLDADGERDAGEQGIPRFEIFADYDGDGIRDPSEPFTVTDEQGDYVLDDIRPPGGSYTLRETLLTSTDPQDWQCSFPHAGTPGGFADGTGGRFACGWGPISAADVPYARGRDFGNWVPARLTVRKVIDPSDDPGRFDLSVNGAVVRAGAGDGDAATVEVRPGTHTVSEAAVPPAAAADYDAEVDCATGTRRASRVVPATTREVTVTSGARVECTFRNTRKGSPGIAIDKTGPAAAERGDVLRYTLYVNNVGTLPFAAAEVEVTDPRCDERPELAAKRDAAGAQDPSPDSLDPGDTWVYRCSHATQPAGEHCAPGLVHNTATVNASAGGSSVEDSDSINTELTCPVPKVPGVAIEKIGPGSAPAGSTLTFNLYVYNVGEVPFKASAVDVTDSNCDGAPEFAVKLNASRDADASPSTLDPGDVWVYACTRATHSRGADCRLSTVSNTGSVEATGGGSTVEDNDTAETLLTCDPVPPGAPTPPVPPVPPPAPADSGEPAVAPPGPEPPEAGVAGTTALPPLKRCLRRGSRVAIRGTKIATVQVFVGGDRILGLTVRPLQRRAIVRLRRSFTPGRYRATAVVRFERGAGTPTLRLRREVRVCASRAARFTG